MRRDQNGFGLCQRWERGNVTRSYSPVKGGGRVSVELTSRTFLPSSGIPQPQNPSLDCSSCFSGEIQWHSHLLPHQALGRGKGSAPVEE